MGGLEDVLSLRNLASEEDAEKLIQTMSLSEVDYRSKIVILLKALEDQLFKASISDVTLEILENLEQLLPNSSSSSSTSSNPITTTMKSAYCRVAVDCTLKYLASSYPTYLQAVDRIWRGTVQAIASHGSPLFSDDLKNWKTEIENSLSDTEVINKFLSLPDTQREALQKVEMFLDEAWDNLYASFLHSAAQSVSDSEQRRRASLIKDMYAAIVDDGSRDTTTSCSKIASMPIDEDSKIGESLQCSSMELENQELEDMNQEAHSEYHNANSYVANSQDDCQSINNNEANLKEAARSHEGGTTSNTVGVTLRRSKRKNFSPLKDHEPTEVTKRRRRNKWSESEVDNLRAGVLKFGRGWKKILNFYGFEKKTAVDLKDKWTNILKSEAKQNKGKQNICK